MTTPSSPDHLRAPQRSTGPLEWAKENFFSSAFNALLTVLFAVFLGWVAYRLGRFVFVDARWEIIERNVANLLVFRFPRDELWRPWAAMCILAATGGFALGVTAKLRARQVEEGRARQVAQTALWRRALPAVVLVGVLLWFGGSLKGVYLSAGIVALGLVCRTIGRRVAQPRARTAVAAAGSGLIAALIVLVAFGGESPSDWGGLLLTIFLAVGGIALSFPLGILLALGRRSSLPAVQTVCVAYIELIRGVPLITLLFMGSFIIGFFLPPGTDAPSIVMRGLIAIVMFTAAYVAEIVRGGLQAVPKGQTEAAQALGLSPFAATRLIVLPQALRAVIPAMVGQFISLFKDTSLVFIIGLVDLLGVAEAITKQPDFIAQGLIFETLIFISLVFWIGSYSMSRESRRLEQRLGSSAR